jgi:ribonuclease BN (tRNA processing enzyme)
MKLIVIGSGGAFAPISRGNSNFLFISDSGKHLVFDMGQTFPYIYRDEWGFDFRNVDAVFISHLHADHASIEQFAFSRYFIQKTDGNGLVVKPKLFMPSRLMKEGWENSFKGGLESLQGKIMHLTDYFECHPIPENRSFFWEGYSFTPIQTVHIRSGYSIKYSYGLAIKKSPFKEGGKTSKIVCDTKYDLYITSDTMFDRQLIEYYNKSNLVLSDCETLPFRSNVHPNYMDLITLPDDCKSKMWLYHYGEKVNSWRDDGFAGFVEKGQEFNF